MQSLQVFLTHNMKITVALMTLSESMSASGERGPKRAVEANATTRGGFLAPEDSFKFKIDCNVLPPDSNCTQVT